MLKRLTGESVLKLIVRLLAVLAFCSTGLASAGNIQYEFSGSIDRVEVFDPSTTPDFGLGDSFSGIFSYDDDAPLNYIIEPDTRALYNTGTIAATVGTTSYASVSGPQLQIFDNWTFVSSTTSIDDFFLSVFQYDAVGDGFYLLQLNMRDYTTTVLNSLDIPTTDQVEQLAVNGRFILRRFSDPASEEWWGDGDFNGVSAVPIPATIPLFAIGLAGLGWSRRKSWA
jgi:hypothetical protein